MKKATRSALAVVLPLALLVTAVPVATQPTKVYRVGVVHQGGSFHDAVEGLRDGLRELGFEEGKQFVLSIHNTKGDLKAVAVAARKLEADQVDLIYALSTSVSVQVKRATRSVPIVFYAGTDPVAIGLVESLRKPGSRLTGVFGQNTDLTAKRLELLKEMVPRLRRVVAYYSPDNPATQESLRLAREAAHQLKVELVERPVASVEELRAALRALRPGEVDGYLSVSDAMMTGQADLVIETTRAKRLPIILQDREAVTRGALASYGASFYAAGRLSAKQVQRILLGASPGDLPVEQIDRLQLVLNLKTARAIGLAIPPAVRARADEVIE